MSNPNDRLTVSGPTLTAEQTKVELIEEALTKNVAGGGWEWVNVCGEGSGDHYADTCYQYMSV